MLRLSQIWYLKAFALCFILPTVFALNCFFSNPSLQSAAAAMGKASRWFRGLLGLKSSTDSSQSQVQKQSSSKKKWSFVKSRKEKADLLQKPRNDVVSDDHEASNPAMAMAAATAAVAEAAVAAAQAAAAVVQLTSSGRNISVAPGIVDDEDVGVVAAAACVSRSEACCRSREERAAVTIQSHFRAYLSRRALRALKALVRLQALVRGHLVRKQTTYVLRRLQALVRAQVRARAGRVVSESPHSSIKLSHFNYPGPATPEKFDHVLRSRSLKQEQLAMLKRNGSKSSRNTNNSSEKSHVNHICTDSRMGERLWEQRSCTRPTTDNYQTDKVLEIDTGKPQEVPKCKSFVYSNLTQGSDSNYSSFSASKDSTARQPVPSRCGTPQSSSHPLNLEQDVTVSAYCTADNSPTFYSASSMGSSKRGAFTPTSSDCSRSCLSGYSDHPSYMAYTESSKAKVRSLSAPKLRPQLERSNSTKKYSVHTFGDSRYTQRGSVLHTNFTNKAYPGSGRLDRLGIHA